MLGGNERHADRMTRIRQQIERLGLESFIEIIGFVPLAAVKTQLCQSQILLNIRREGIYSRSGLSTKLSEYLASGRLVISSEVGDVSKYLDSGKNAILVSSKTTVTEIVAALETALKSSELRHTIGAAGREVAIKNFDVSVAKAKLQVILDRVLQTNPSGVA
jgi:glycosyltransferase involved in cell wall biosynthesis